MPTASESDRGQCENRITPAQPRAVAQKSCSQEIKHGRYYAAARSGSQAAQFSRRLAFSRAAAAGRGQPRRRCSLTKLGFLARQRRRLDIDAVATAPLAGGTADRIERSLRAGVFHCVAEGIG